MSLKIQDIDSQWGLKQQNKGITVASMIFAMSATPNKVPL